MGTDEVVEGRELAAEAKRANVEKKKVGVNSCSWKPLARNGSTIRLYGCQYFSTINLSDGCVIQLLDGWR